MMPIEFCAYIKAPDVTLWLTWTTGTGWWWGRDSDLACHFSDSAIADSVARSQCLLWLDPQSIGVTPVEAG
jgi:hypothetical protein